MKNEIIHFEKRQIWLLSDGNFILIYSVSGINNRSDIIDDALCFFTLGHKYIMNEEIDNKNIFIVENGSMETLISFNVSTNSACTINELGCREAQFIGSLIEEKFEEYYTKLTEYHHEMLG